MGRSNKAQGGQEVDPPSFAKVERRVATGERRAAMEHQRVNTGLLAAPERRVLHWLAERTPAWVRPDHLTALGVAGAVLVMIGFLAANWSSGFVLVVIAGLFLNWYGDSLDGTLARYRRIERPHLGYFIDHSCDLISQAFMFIGLGLSPWFTLTSALLALSMYLLMTSYTYLKVMILRTHQLAYGGMGATELRVALAIWSLAAIWANGAVTETRWEGLRVLDEAVGVLWVAIFLGFMALVRADLARFAAHFADQGEAARAWPEPRRGPAQDRPTLSAPAARSRP